MLFKKGLFDLQSISWLGLLQEQLILMILTIMDMDINNTGNITMTMMKMNSKELTIDN